MTFIIILLALWVIATILVWWDKLDGWYRGLPILIVTLAFCAVQVPMYLATKDGQGADKMVLNGQVVKKYQERTSCSHSYSCNCRVVSQGKTSTTKCDTCYEHPYDFNWVVKSNLGYERDIQRVDRRGSDEPPRWTAVKMGEPFSVEVSYFNYIRASPLSVFKDYNAYEKVQIPHYPKVYDYYRIKHTINWKSQYVSGINSIDQMLGEKLKISSAKAKANVVVIFYGGSDDLVEATKVKNFGGRINDLTVMIRADKDGNIRHVGAFSWSKSDMVNVMVRDEILDLGQLNPENNEKLVDILNNTLLKYYQHRDNEEFQYLEENIVLPTWYYVVSVFLTLIVVGANIFLSRK